MTSHDFAFSSHDLAVVLVTGLIVFACVLLHYESFTGFHKVLTRATLLVRRRRILFLMFGLLALHVVEVWLFGIGYYYLLFDGQTRSSLQGLQSGGLLEFVYYSAVVYTTLGLGDLIPHGAIRFMTGTEALTGFLLITWSASFTFLEMERLWRRS